MTTVNQLLVTKGMGAPTQALVTLGFIPIEFVVVTVEKVRKRKGGRRPKDQKYPYDLYEEYKISAYLVEVNGKELVNPIVNNVKKIFETNVKIDVKASAEEVEYHDDKDFRVWVSGLRIRRN